MLVMTSNSQTARLVSNVDVQPHCWLFTLIKLATSNKQSIRHLLLLLQHSQASNLFMTVSTLLHLPAHHVRSNSNSPSTSISPALQPTAGCSPFWRYTLRTVNILTHYCDRNDDGATSAYGGLE
jgi:hypothetical protein